MLMAARQRSLSLLEQKLNSMCLACIITVYQASFHLKDWFLLKSHSEVLERSPYIPAGEIPQGLAKGRVYDV
jgi:hypothetical protein